MKASLFLMIAECFSLCISAQGNQSLRAIAEYAAFDTTVSGAWDLQPTDSIEFGYTQGRRSRFDYNKMDYLEVGNTFSLRNPFVGSVNKIIVPNNIDSFDNSLATCFDNAYHFEFSSQNIPVLADSVSASYYPTGALQKLTCVSLKYHDSASCSFVYYFGKLIKASYVNAPMVERFFATDVAGNYAYDSITFYGWLPYPAERVYTYDFDANGHYTARNYLDFFLGGGSSPQDAVYYTYNPDGTVHTKLAYLSGEPSVMDTFFYTTGVPGITGYQEYEYQSNIMLPNPTISYYTHINSRGQKDTLTLIWHNTDAKIATSIIYDSSGLPIRRVDDFYSGTNKARHVKFYYYGAALSVSEVAKRISLISLSPNPVSSKLSLHYRSPLPNTPITVSISNTAGQLLHSETFIPKGDKTDITFGDEVPPGLYAISVFGSGNSVLYKGTFLKQ